MRMYNGWAVIENSLVVPQKYKGNISFNNFTPKYKVCYNMDGPQKYYDK